MHSFLRLRSMRARMTALFALCTVVVMTLGGALVMHHERRVAEERVAATLNVAALRARTEVEETEYAYSTLLEVARADQAEIAAGGLVLFVTNANGKLLWRSRKIDFPLDRSDWRTTSIRSGAQALVLASSWQPVESELRETALALLGLGLFLVVCAAIGAWFLVGITLSPIDALTAQVHNASVMHNASVKGLSVQLEAPSPDWEMVRLATTLNNLLDQLEHEARSRGRFYLAASHELRTPLQALLGSLDVALSRPRGAREYERSLQEAQTQTERLARLVQDLLQLNALEMRASSPSPSYVNLADSIERVIVNLAGLIQSRGIHLETTLPDVEIEAPPSHLEVLLRNIIENAIKYATPGSTVELTLVVSATQVQLRVFNCYELNAHDTEAWFEPFYRPDASRNSQTGGNGLGLAIAAAVARDNNWPLDLQTENGGVLATARWLLANSSPCEEAEVSNAARNATSAEHSSTPR